MRYSTAPSPLSHLHTVLQEREHSYGDSNTPENRQVMDKVHKDHKCVSGKRWVKKAMSVDVGNVTYTYSQQDNAEQYMGKGWIK